MRRGATVIVGLLLVGLAIATGGGSTVGRGQVATPAGTPAPVPCAGEAFAPTIEVVLRVRPASGAAPSAAELDETRAVVARRAETLSPGGCRVWTDGDDELLVQLADDVEEDVAVPALSEIGLLEIVDTGGEILPSGTPIRTSLGDPAGAGGTPAADTVYQTIVGGGDVADAFITTNQAGQYAVGFELTPAAADRLCEFTGNNLGRPLALVLDKAVVAAPVVNSPICGGQGIVEGLALAETQALVVQLLAGTLPVPVEVVAVHALGQAAGHAAGAPAAEATIPGEQTFAYRGAEHSEGPIDYAEEPPAGGPHNPAWQTCGVYDEPIPNETAVHSLEHGAVWITYRPDLAADQVEALRRLAKGQSYVLVSPYPGLDVPIVVTAWNHQLRLESVDDPRLEAFVDLYRRNPETTPEFGGTCEGGLTGTRAEWLADQGAGPATAPAGTPRPAAGPDPTAGGCWTEAQASGSPDIGLQWTAPPAMVIDPAGRYSAVVETNLGSFTIELLPTAAPATVNNFVCLARAGYYDGTPFHRVIAGFVIQGGDPTGTGGGDPGYAFADELPMAESYRRGTVAMANAGPNTNGSQFFVCLDDLSTRLPKNYAIFGRVVAGMDVVDAIAAVPVGPNPSNPNEPSSPREPVFIERVTIVEDAATPAA